MSTYIFEKFEEVEESIRKIAPPVVYKYRSDWNNSYHRELIIKQSLWFAAPRDLNDPYDIRTPVQFDVSEIENPGFLNKLMEGLKIVHPGVAFTDRDLRILAENRLEGIRKNARHYFEKNYRDIREGPIFDRIGLFSCSADGENETMWAHYGNSGNGFAVGFNTVELARDLMCTIGPVTYSDIIPLHSFINSKDEGEPDLLFLKSKKWGYEKEFRFIIIGDDDKVPRVHYYSAKSVAELLLGANFPKGQRAEIISEIKKGFPIDIPIYQLHTKVSGYGFDRERL